MVLVVGLVTLLVLTPCLGGNCPSPCTCKWKGGKQTVECTERGLITIPESVDPETQVLDLSGNNLQILPRETFVRSGLLNLQRVFLRRCRIGQIDNLAFRGLTNLIELDLSHNLLTAVPSGTFRDVPFLRDLVLAYNPIQKIDSQAFKTIPGLIKLDLSNCEIQVIASKAFEGIEMLESLKLNGNRLSELRLRTVETLNRLHGIEMHDNPWHCDCRLRAVKEWLVNNNIPYPISPVCSGGPERLIDKTFTELHIDDFACKPEILPVNRYIEATSGSNATILCRANAIPVANINWYWNGRPLLNNSAFSSHQRIHVFEEGKQEKRSVLVLTNVQEINSSEFYCVAENRAGNAEANFTLHVTMRAAGITTLGSGQIAGLSVALIILIIFILLVIFVLLVRLRRIPFSESKTEVVTVVNGTSNGKVEEPSTGHTKPTELNFCNPVQKPPRLSDSTIPASCFVSPSSASGNNPDLINDTKPSEECEVVERPASGEYSRNADSLYPSGLWETEYSRQVNFYDDKTPIMDGMSGGGSLEELAFRAQGYPADYGLPIADKQQTLPTNAKTLRVWQKGGVPVLPPVTALKRALTHSRNSPDEGYQEGCGTDV
ncbi:leucine-rich repeat-containing protein 24 [Tribolium madens]|uniref:leucine-rich repeat-containing protein 24 n=1 Tax=Tribolium madens TaxID=41895 RepID=UPI001CF74B9B|nr:leucine-rich repeat-containing protein 24 [Tribolium madens]